MPKPRSTTRDGPSRRRVPTASWIPPPSGLILARGTGVACGNPLHESPGRHVVRHDRPRARLGTVAHVDRRNKRRVHTRVYTVSDRGAVLVLAVVVRGDRAGTEVGVGADLGVADVGEVRHL